MSNQAAGAARGFANWVVTNTPIFYNRARHWYKLNPRRGCIVTIILLTITCCCCLFTWASIYSRTPEGRAAATESTGLTQTAALFTPIPTRTTQPTNTSSPTKTQSPSNTPTPTKTQPPSDSPTPANTPTPEPTPWIGSINCPECVEAGIGLTLWEKIDNIGNRNEIVHHGDICVVVDKGEWEGIEKYKLNCSGKEGWLRSEGVVPSEIQVTPDTRSSIVITEVVIPTLPTNIDVCIPRNTLIQKGVVTQIIDGDTIQVQLDDGTIYRVRYIGIDTPEIDSPLYSEAKQTNFDLVSQKEILLIKDVSEIDGFDRLLRYVVVGDIFVNQELVELGLAEANSYPPDIACDAAFSAAQQQAQQASVGLWIPTQTPEPAVPLVVIVSVNKEAEYVDIKNTGNIEVNLQGWLLVSERGNQTCNLAGVLSVGQTLRVWAGSAQNGGYGCGYSSPIWNNSESDPAVLYNPQGVEVSRR